MEKQPSPATEMLAQAAAQAVETDPVLSELDGVLDADPLYQQLCVKLDGLGSGATLGEVLLRLLLVKHLYDWNGQQTAEQVEDSLVLRWFCRLGLQPAPAVSTVSQAASRVSVAELEALANRVEQASERGAVAANVPTALEVRGHVSGLLRPRRCIRPGTQAGTRD